jgi:cobalt/nickel transport system permease protein
VAGKEEQMNPSASLKAYVTTATTTLSHHVGHSLKPGKTAGLVGKSILQIVGFIREAVATEDIASRKGFLQSCDPRYKTLGIALLLVGVSISRSHAVLACYYLVSAALAIASAIAIGFFMKRTLLFIPLFSMVIAIPAIFGFVTPGEPVLSLSVLTAKVTVTRQGIDSACIFMLRVLASVSLAIVLVLTTRHNELLKVLRIFKVPQVFVMTMAMSYRYLFILLDAVQKTFTAIKSRVGYVAAAGTGRRIAGAAMSGLWLRSYQLQSQVYGAMLSRGYAGEPRVLADFRAGTIDIAFLGFTLCVFLGTVCMNLYFQ